MKAPLEKDIQRQCLDWLAVRGVFAIRINSGAMQGSHNGKKWFIRLNSEPGCSDILACGEYRGRKGVFIALEIKRPGNKPTPVQQSFLDMVARKGGLSAVITSVEDLETLFYGKVDDGRANDG